MAKQTVTPVGQDDLQLIAASQLAKVLSISTRTVWRLLSSGKLVSPIRIGGNVRWNLAEVRRWIDEGCPDPMNFK